MVGGQKRGHKRRGYTKNHFKVKKRLSKPRKWTFAGYGRALDQEPTIGDMLYDTASPVTKERYKRQALDLITSARYAHTGPWDHDAGNLSAADSRFNPTQRLSDGWMGYLGSVPEKYANDVFESTELMRLYNVDTGSMGR
jgi:hypothetical protein